MRKSKLDTLETRRLILKQASRLFQTRGLESTSIADIMAAANLTQGGFYRHFESKEQLIAEANDLAFDSLLVDLRERVGGLPPDKAVKLIVRRYLHQHADFERVYLCPLATNGCQLGRMQKDVKAQALVGFEGLTDLIREVARKLDAANPRSLAESIIAMMIGAVALSQLANDQVRSEKILANAEGSLGLLISSSVQARR